MKQLFIVLSFIILQKGAAQGTFNRAYHNINEKPNPFLLQIFGDLFFTSTCFEAYDYGKSYLYKYNNTGSQKFRSTTLSAYLPQAGFKTNDNFLFVTGKNPICDVQGPTQVNFIAKIDTGGTAAFISSYTVAAFDDYKTSIQYSDSSYFIFTDSVLFKYSKTGTFISKVNTGLKYISSSLLLPNNNILLSAKQASIVSLVEITPSGSAAASYAVPALLSKMEFYGTQGIIGRGTNNALYKISPSKSILGVSSFSNALDFKYANDSIYSVSAQNYTLLDTSFNILYTASVSTQNMSYNNVALNGSKVALLGTGKATNNYVGFGTHNYFSLNQVGKTTAPVFASDVAVISAAADSMYSNYIMPGNFNTYLRAKVTVKNNGSATINSFKLNCYSYQMVSCGSVFYQETFNGLNLQPGSMLTVTTGSFVHKRFYSAPTPSVTYCFYSTVPNGETDNVFSDNELCTSFAVPVGIKTNFNEHTDLILWPNPFTDEIKLNIDGNVSGIEIYNTIGELVLKAEGKNETLDTTDLPAGIYFFKIAAENSYLIKKAVKN
jgi:hypothetical protein